MRALHTIEQHRPTRSHRVRFALVDAAVPYSDAGETVTFTYNDFRRESVTVNERGHTRRFFFDANANLVQLVEENGAKRDYTYDTNDFTRRLSKRDPEGYLTSYAYDATGNVNQITNPSGNTVAMSNFTPFNQPGKLKDARGNYTLLKYDAKGNLTDEIVLKKGIGASYVPASYTPVASELVAWTIHTYDSYGNRATTKRVRDFTTQAGPIFTYVYDANGLNVVNLKRQGDKNGDGTLEAVETSPTLVYDSLGRPTTDLAANWYTATKVYDSVDRIIQATDALGNLRDFKYDPNGNPIEQTLSMTPAGVPTLIDHTAAQYDLSDRKTASLDSAGNVTAYTYDAMGNVVKVTNPDNYSLAFDYNEANHVVKAYDQEGHAVTKTLDLSGKPRSITDPNGNTVTYEYYGSAKDGRLQKTLDPAGRATVFDYDANGNAISVTLVPNDASGNRVTLTDYDELNRPVRNVGPVTTDATLGQYRPVTKTAYNALGQPVQVSAGRTDLTGTNPAADIAAPQVTYTFDDFGRKIKETDPLGKYWAFEYDPNNNLTRSTDAKGQITQYTYGYGGQLLTRTDATGKKTAYTYNALGQVLTAQTPEVTYSHAYDPAHRLAAVTDSRAGKKISYAWSPGGLLNLMTDNEGHRTDYLYDAVGRLTGIWAPNYDYVSFVYDAGGRLTEKWFPNGINAQYTWNSDNTLAQVRNRFNYSDTFIVSQHDYSYNGVGQRKDALEKLGAYTPPAMNEAYAYDPLGNRTTKSDAGGPLYYVYDNANQLKEIRQTNATGALLTAMIYDANGNLTQKCEGGSITANATSCTGASIATLTYDALNRLAQVDKDGQLSQYAYDDANRRIRKTVNGSTTNYLYNGPDIQAEYQNWSQASISYTHGPNTDDPVIRVTAANDASYFHQDGLGSVVATTDQSGNLTAAQLYDAWGKPQPTASLNNLGQYGYTGREPDETGMMYYRARYYDPAIGRFTQRDPIGLGGGINQYAYVNGDPVNITDPTGNCGPLTPLCVAALEAGAGTAIRAGAAAAANWARSSATIIAAKAAAGFAMGYEGAKLTGTNSELGRIGAGIVGAMGLGGSTQIVNTIAKTGLNKVASTVVAAGTTGSAGEFAGQVGDKLAGVRPELDFVKVAAMFPVTATASVLGGEMAIAALADGAGFSAGVTAAADTLGTLHTTLGSTVGSAAYDAISSYFSKDAGAKQSQSLTNMNPPSPPKP